MWSDAARASSMQSRGMSGASAGGGGSLAGGGSMTGGSASMGPVANVSGGGQAIQSRLAQAGANSRGRWAPKSKGTHTKATITGAAVHQQGVQAIARNMRAASNGAPGYGGSL